MQDVRLFFDSNSNLEMPLPTAPSWMIIIFLSDYCFADR